MILAHFGTFDVENYGDLLFPLILEKRLGDSPFSLRHVSPVGGPPVWVDCRPSESAATLLADAVRPAAVVIGGGHIISSQPTRLSKYAHSSRLSLTAYPQLWLGAAMLAARANAPLCWNAPGVPAPFSPTAGSMIEWVASVSDYVAVRDNTSRERLVEAGLAGAVHVVPDSGLDVAHLWAARELDEAYAQAFTRRGRDVPRRTLAVHVSRRFAAVPAARIAACVDRLSRALQATPLLIALGPCHGDDQPQRRVAAALDEAALVIDRPHSLREVAACIARSVGFVGSSLHGLVTACAFGRPALAVMPTSAVTYSKLADFAARFGLSSCLCESWSDAASHVSTAWQQLEDACARVPATAAPLLDTHWQRLRAGLGLDGAHGVARDKSAALDRLSRSSNAPSIADAAYGRLLEEQAGQVPELLRALDESVRQKRQTLADLSRNESTRNRLLLAELERAKQQHEQLTSCQQKAQVKLERLRASQDKLCDWLEDLELGIDALLDSRRWRLGDGVGRAWQTLRRKPAVPTVTDLFDDVFTRYRQWKEHYRQLPSPGTLREADAASEMAARATEPESTSRHVAIVVCIHDALAHVRACLESIVALTSLPYRLILVDDGSDLECRRYVEQFASRQVGCQLVRNERSRGYTRAANQGLRAASGEYVVLLNSDTLVSPGWLEKILECGESDPRIGVVGPLSNAASWQSVPERFAAGGDWAVNELPASWTPEDMARAVAATARKDFPRVPLVNGFCLALKRTLIQAIGFFDAEAFPDGYGEENDYCLRARQAGFDLAIADHCYVYHAKTQSYSPARRRKLARSGRAALLRRYGRRLLDDCTDQLRDEPVLARMRRELTVRCRSGEVPLTGGGNAPRILFLLPVKGGGGGAHSIVQEALAMQRLGLTCRVAVQVKDRSNYARQYPRATQAGLFYCYRTTEHLVEFAAQFDVAVATIYHSMGLVKRIVEAQPAICPAYYVQDYEPFFFTRESREWRRARQSYTLVPRAVLFAKTDWLCELVSGRHATTVHKVEPSLDHDVFYPDFHRPASEQPVAVAAMVRPATPRRAPARTLRILQDLKRQLDEKVVVHVFGCSDREMKDPRLSTDFEFHNHGVIPRETVAALLRQVDVFADFSDYQAFGRTALEAMACGAAVVVPRAGGAGEYARDRENSLVVDATSDENSQAALRELVTDRKLRERLRHEALLTASRYSTRASAMSEVLLFCRILAARGDGTAPAEPYYVISDRLSASVPSK